MRNVRRMFYPEVVRNALQVALVVGLVLNLVNQGGALFGGGPLIWSQLLLNFLVPYCVASFSAVRVQPGAVCHCSREAPEGQALD